MKNLGFLAAILLSGCSFIPKPDIETRFVLRPVPLFQNEQTPFAMKRVLGIARPDIPVNLRGNQLVLIRHGEQTYYAGKAWSAPLADTLDAALVRDLAASLPHYIVTGDNGLRKDFELQMEVHQFATIQDDTGTYVQINADIRLVNPLERTIIKMIPFRYRENLSEFSTPATLAAYNKGWEMLIQAISKELD